MLRNRFRRTQAAARTAMRSAVAAQYVGVLSVVMSVLGLLQLFTGHYAYSIEFVLPTIAAVIWNLELLLGGLITAYGVWWKKPLEEALGLRLLALAALLYAVCVLAVGLAAPTPGVSLLSVSLTAGIWLVACVGSVFRAHVLTKGR